MQTKLLTLSALLATTLLVGGCSQGWADGKERDDDHRSDSRGGWFQGRGRDDDDARTRLVTAENPRYRDECGSCHLAYPPGMLSRADWNRVFDGLADHFGDNASLDPALARELREFVLANAGWNDRATAASGTPRITLTPWFQREHDELPARLVAGNPEVGSFANCTACHTQAATGSFREREITIAGYGRWDD